MNRSIRIATAVVIAAAAGSLAIAAPANAATASTTSTTSTTAKSCDLSSWSGGVQSAPHRLKAHSAEGVSLWHTSHGFRLRVTHPGTSAVVFSGTITADEPMHASRYRLEKQDHLTLSADRMTLTYRFVNHGGIDGADFTTDCATTVTLGTPQIGGAAATTSQVFIGAKRTNPAALPVEFTRTPKTA